MKRICLNRLVTGLLNIDNESQFIYIYVSVSYGQYDMNRMPWEFKLWFYKSNLNELKKFINKKFMKLYSRIFVKYQELLEDGCTASNLIF